MMQSKSEQFFLLKNHFSKFFDVTNESIGVYQRNGTLEGYGGRFLIFIPLIL